MKKLIVLMLVLVSVTVFADINISKVEKPNLQNASKGWEGYDGTPSWVPASTETRAVYYSATDFGMDYPVDFWGVQWYLYDDGVPFTYSVYDKDGETLLWQAASDSSESGYHALYADSLILADDFWVVLDGDVASVCDDAEDTSHSFVGSPGNWVLQPSGYNHTMAAYFEPDTTLIAPIVASISGANTFAGNQAVITAKVLDQHGIASITGEYSIEGGAWTPMTAAKGTYEYTTFYVPGQADGVSGAVRFTTTDTLAVPTVGLSKEFPVSWSYDNLVLDEGFEGNTFPPLGWSLNTVGAGFVQASDNPAYNDVRTGDYCAGHYDVNGTQQDWLITPAITMPATGSCSLSFWQVGYYLNYWDATSLQQVKVTKDDGLTWDIIYDDSGATPLVTYDFTNVTLLLADYAGETIKVAWYYEGVYTSQWFIDDVSIVYDNQGPTVVDVAGNPALTPAIGAYLNNDLVINLTANDLTGVASITGNYSYDGTTWTPFALTGSGTPGDVVWSGTIPQLAFVDTGLVHFDMIDLGGNVTPQTSDYTFYFVEDGDAPAFDYVLGTKVLVDQVMDLTVYFNDESAINPVLCEGHYSKLGNWSDTVDFPIAASKVHNYVYTGQLPAETAEVYAGRVKFTFTDVEGNTAESAETLVQWIDGEYLIEEDFEGTPALDNWTLTGEWGLQTGTTYVSASNALTDSPDGIYVDDQTTTATWKTPFDLSGRAAATLSFWTNLDTETAYDYTYFEGSKDGGATWITLDSYDGYNLGWQEQEVDMTYFAGRPNVTFRFRFVADGNTNGDGIYIDDIRLTVLNVDHGKPAILSDVNPPSVFELHTESIEIYDPSGLASVTVYYTEEGGPEQSFVATEDSTDWYNTTIPAAPGSTVEFYIVAVDASPLANQKTSATYSFIKGDHLVYDYNGFDFYHTLDDGDAKAVRCTVPGTDSTHTYKGGLEFILIRNYYYAGNDIISATMRVHVWADNNGEPGDEITPAFDVVPAADAVDYDAYTVIDLRALNLEVTGDFYVGLSADYGEVFLTMEKTGDTGTAPACFERCIYGTLNGSTWDWGAPSTTDNWSIRAIADGNYLGVPFQPVVASGIVGNDVTLDWAACSFATGYNVYKSADPYGTFALVDYTTALTYTYTETAEKMFYYVVSTDEAPAKAPKTIRVTKPSERR